MTTPSQGLNLPNLPCFIPWPRFQSSCCWLCLLEKDMLGKGNGWAGVTQVPACLASWCLESTGFASSSLNKGSCALNNSLVKSWGPGCLSGRRFWCCQLCGCEQILASQRFSSIEREFGDVFFKGYWAPRYKLVALTQSPLNLFLKLYWKFSNMLLFCLGLFSFFLWCM